MDLVNINLLMKRAFFFILFLAIVYFYDGQITGVQWQKAFGTSDIETIYPIQKTKHQGIILFYGSYASSPNTLKLVKINKSWFIEWQKSILPNMLNYKASIVTNNNELYLLGESSKNNHGGSDICIGKISADGNLLGKIFWWFRKRTC